MDVTKLKRILILTADAGFGHRSAANAVAAALQELHGGECAIEIVNPLDDKRAPSFLRDSQSDYDRMVREMPNLYEVGYQASDAAVPSTLVERALAVLLFEVMRDMVRRYEPDVIVSTYPLYQAPLGAVYAITRRYVPLITVITDLATVHRLWFAKTPDLCLVPTEVVRQLAIGDGLAPEKVQITGLPVQPLLSQENRDPAAIRAELGWRPDLKTALAVGSKRVEHLEDMLHVLNHSRLPLQLAVVAGGDDELYHRLQSAEWHMPAHIYNLVKNMPTLMHASDCIICKAGGLIVSESLACGLPLLLIDVIPGQEVGNANYVVEGGAGELASTPVGALESIFHWLDRGGELLATRAQNARRLGRPRAAYEVAERVWAAAERGPAVRASRSILGRSKLIDLLRRNGVPWQEPRKSDG
jgi:1,2-diacylglycerol 3-beta-galactosyltransferase